MTGLPTTQSPIHTETRPHHPDDKSDKSPDQGTAFFDDTKKASADGADSRLRFTRGDGLLARMLHIHAGVVEEVSAAS